MILPPSILLDLTRRYCEPHRRYHTIQHVADMLWRGRELHLDDHQIMAIWYHDAVYDVPPDSNERRSAELAERQLREAGWPEESVAVVSQIVRDTEKHLPTIDASKFVIDLDLATLADDWSCFEVNTAAIRAEYSCYDDAEFARGQSEFFTSFLARERIYHSAWGEPLEAAARENLQRLIAG